VVAAIAETDVVVTVAGEPKTVAQPAVSKADVVLAEVAATDVAVANLFSSRYGANGESGKWIFVPRAICIVDCSSLSIPDYSCGSSALPMRFHLTIKCYICVAGVAHGIRCYKCGQYNEGVGSITPCINYTSHMLMECSSSDEWCIVSTIYIFST